MCRAAVSQVASDINTIFQDPSRGELTNKNDNGVTYTSILVNNAVGSFNDPALISNAQNRINGSAQGPYQRVGIDASLDRQTRELFGFNYFRLGLESTLPFPNTSDQRRIMIINGVTREILFSFTPTGDTVAVRAQLSAMKQQMTDAVNSVSLVTELEPIGLSSVAHAPGSLTINFGSAAGITDFRIMASTTLQGFPMDLTSDAQIQETSAGSYQAVIDLTSAPEKLFLRVER